MTTPNAAALWGEGAACKRMPPIGRSDAGRFARPVSEVGIIPRAVIMCGICIRANWHNWGGRHLGSPDPELGLHGPTAQRDINKRNPTMTDTTAKEGWGR
jgi:hypothetical protein